MSKEEIFRKIVEYVKNNELATIDQIAEHVFGSKSMRTITSYLLAILCLYDVLKHHKIGRAVIFRVKNLENLQKLIKDWDKKVWF